MTKLTPAKRLKQLKQNGWLGFVEFMEFKGLSPRDICRRPEHLNDYAITKTSCWLGQDIEYDMFANIPPTANFGKMVGLLEQLTNPRDPQHKTKKTNKNKMVRKGKYE